MSSAFKTIALIGKYKSPEIAEPLLRLADFLQGRGVRIVLDPLTARTSARTITPCCRSKTSAVPPTAIVIAATAPMLNIARTFAPYTSRGRINQGGSAFSPICRGHHVRGHRSILDGSLSSKRACCCRLRC